MDEASIGRRAAELRGRHEATRERPIPFAGAVAAATLAIVVAMILGFAAGLD